MTDRDDARPEFNPRHRIVGAIVLVALVVIFVPMILSGREPPPELRGGREAPREVVETRTVVTPVPAEAPQSPENGETVKVVQVPVEPKPVETKPAPPAEKPAEAKKPEPAPSGTVARIENGWMVQVGTFTNTDNATRLRDRLRGLGYSVQTDAVMVSGKKAMRLRVGPFADRARADKAQARIRKETGVAGVVQSPS